jgi:hypothetical protein
VVNVDYYLSNAAPEVPLEEFGRVAKAEHRIEQCIQRSKSEAGLDQYEVRNWTGWYHHQTLSLIATWFLVTETRRGKKPRIRPCPGPPQHSLRGLLLPTRLEHPMFERRCRLPVRCPVAGAQPMDPDA